jgi:hypothetical protein
MRRALAVTAAAAVTVAATPPAAEAAIIRATTAEGAVTRLLSRYDYGPPRRVTCARVTARRWSCDWRAPLAGEFPCRGVASATRSATSRTTWVVFGRVTAGDSLCT